MNAIEIRELNKTFTDAGKEPLRILENISLEIPEGEFVTIVGRSGCGKSTLLRIICGLETKDSGTVLRKGTPVTDTDASCGMVFQEHRLLPWLTVADNISFGLKNMTAAEKRELVRPYLAMTGLSDFAESYPSQLSGGMAQRAAIARGLATHPEILLLDEPFAALDALTRLNMQDEVLKIRRSSGITMVLVTHDIEEAVYLGNRVIVMSERPGKIAEIIRVPEEAHGNRDSDAFLRCREEILSFFFRGRRSGGSV